MKNKLRESTTLKFVFLSWLAINYMWLSGRVESTLTEYGMAVAAVLTVWLGREWRAAHYESNTN